MANKNTGTRTETAYEFALTHEDIVSMMNDPQVLLEGGDVSDDQEFQLILKKSNGSEILLRDMKSTDTLIFRYKKVDIEQEPESYSGIDVDA
jgi:hypothetical protein